MLNPLHLIQALEAAGADGNVLYVSVPITSGVRELRAMRALGLRSSVDFRNAHPDRWRVEVVEPNEREARRHTASIREALWARGQLVVDPSRMQVEGWGQDDYNGFWIELMRRHVRRLVATPDWESSRGARGEVGYAMALGLQVVDLSGRPIEPGELERRADEALSELRSAGWPAAEAGRYLPPLDIAARPDLRPSAQSQVFTWLGDERQSQVRFFGAASDDEHTVADGIRADGWWRRRLDRYWGRAEADGIDTAAGRLALAKYVATACGVLESVVRLHGGIPDGEPGASRERDAAGSATQGSGRHG